MNNVVDITHRLPQHGSPLDLEEGLVDPELVKSVDRIEEVVQAMARVIAIELVRRGCARVDLVEYLCAEGLVPSITIAEG